MFHFPLPLCIKKATIWQMTQRDPFFHNHDPIFKAMLCKKGGSIMIKMGVKKIGEPIIIPEPNNGHSKKTAMQKKSYQTVKN